MNCVHLYSCVIVHTEALLIFTEILRKGNSILFFWEKCNTNKVFIFIQKHYSYIFSIFFECTISYCANNYALCK